MNIYSAFNKEYMAILNFQRSSLDVIRIVIFNLRDVALAMKTSGEKRYLVCNAGNTSKTNILMNSYTSKQRDRQRDSIC